MFIALSTVANRADADRLASAVVTLGLAACVQIDGPITSLYQWEGKVERAEEFRLVFKCAEKLLPQLESHVLAHHPYDTPQWIVVHADRVSEKYLSWVEANPTNLPL